MDLPDGFVSGLPNCGITAIAAATGTNYSAVWDWFKARGKRRASWRGRTHHRDYLPALYHFGFKKSARQFAGVGSTLSGFVDWHTVKGATYLVRVSGHVVTVRDGIILDNIKIAPAAEHPKARSVVKDIWLVAA